MKYVKTFLLLLTIFLTFSISNINVNALTINDYQRELDKLKEEKRKQEEADEKVKQEIEQKKQEMAQVNEKIKQATNDIADKEKEIKDYEGKIEVKEEQIKDLVSFLQVSNSENFYLKYIFGAESFTDLIYRISVVEQLTTKSNELIAEMSNLIKENKQNIEELENKKVELNKLNREILDKISSLGKERDSFFDEVESIDEQISIAEKQIKQYRDLGCKDNEELSTCTSLIPSSSGFIRPVKSGIITDDYGWRVDPCDVCSDFHKGMDIGGNSEGTPVLSSAAGKVVNIAKYSCGGKVLTIDHNINGVSYATRYWHLYEIDVNVGDFVVQGQQVAKVGGGNTLYYDPCSTGAHLHFEVLEGHYFAATYLDQVRNPRDYVNFPAYGAWW